MRALEFIRDHVTFKLPYDFSYQMKTPKASEHHSSATIFLDTYSQLKQLTLLKRDMQSLLKRTFSEYVHKKIFAWEI